MHALGRGWVNNFEIGDSNKYELTSINFRMIGVVVVKIKKARRLNGDAELDLEKLRISVGYHVDCCGYCPFEILSLIPGDVVCPFYKWITANSEIFHQTSDC